MDSQLLFGGSNITSTAAELDAVRSMTFVGKVRMLDGNLCALIVR